MTALTLALLNSTEALVNSPLLAGTVAVALVLCLTITPREERVLRQMDRHTQADIGLPPYAPSWLNSN